MHKKILILLFTFPLLFSCTSKEEKLQTQKEIKRNHLASENYDSLQRFLKDQDLKLDYFIENMPLEEKVAQMFIQNLEGYKSFINTETYFSITHNPRDIDRPLISGGYLFFSYNIAPDFQQEKAFIDSINDFAERYFHIKPYLAVDQEGGWVNRLKKITFNLPSQEEVALTYSLKDATKLYSSMALQMSQMGFNMNLAPVIEVSTEKNKHFLDGRSFGDFQTTVKYGTACINAYEFNNVGTVIKHFPGNTNTDPHTGLPEIKDDYDELMKSIESFKNVIQNNLTGIQPSGILMSHVRTSAVDPDFPACLSKVWIADILRNEWKYEGLIFSDDIYMGALANNGYTPEKTAIMEVEAGIDCIMVSDKRIGSPARAVYLHALEDKEFEEKINKAVKRILVYKLKKNIFSLENYERHF